MKSLNTLIIFLFFACFSSFAQKTYIVAFDCTRSMIHPEGDYSVNGRDSSSIWKPAKDNIHNLWEQADKEDTFHILLYQKEIISEIHGKKAALSWFYIDSKMEEAITKGGNTCIYNAWRASSRYFTEGCYFYFITDGIEDHDDNGIIDTDEQNHIDLVCNMINEFCSNHMYGFYTNLNINQNDFNNNKIARTIDSSCFKLLIGGKWDPASISLDQNDINNGEKTSILTFKPICTEEKINIHSINAEIVCSNEDSLLVNADKYFKVDASDIQDGKLSLLIRTTEAAVPYDQLRDNNCKFKVRIEPSDKTIFPQSILVNINYFFEKVAYLPASTLIGHSKYHPAFRVRPLVEVFPNCDLIRERIPDTIKFDLSKMMGDTPLFNNEAKKNGSCYQLQLVPKREKDKKANIAVYKNGIICGNNIIDVKSSDTKLVISVLFNKNNCEPGKYKFNLKPCRSYALDKINENANTDDFSVPVILEYKKVYNPLEVILLVLLAVFFMYTLIRFILKNVIARRIMNHDIFLGPDYINPIAQIDGNGCVKCILTNRYKSGKNNIFNRIYNGTTQFVFIDNVVSDIYLFADKSGSLNIKHNMTYSIDGLPFLSDVKVIPGNIYKFCNTHTNNTFTIIIN